MKAFDLYYSSPYAKQQKSKLNPLPKILNPTKPSESAQKASSPASSPEEGPKDEIDIIEEY